MSDTITDEQLLIISMCVICTMSCEIVGKVDLMSFTETVFII